MKEHTQDRWPIRFDWGPAGMQAVAADVDTVIVVDVLSFSTCVDVAVERGAEIFPFPWNDDRAAGYAQKLEAELAGARGSARYSLSPASFLDVEPGRRIVLPSPNGATLCLTPTSASVLCGCLRNASAVAEAVLATGGSCAIVAAGERWSDGSLRPCLEDLLGAGAILDRLGGGLSPEAEIARLAYSQVEAEIVGVLARCASGRELIARGYGRDVEIAGELDASGAVPVLDGDCFRGSGS